MTKRTFDLALGVFVGGYAAMTGARLWAGKRLATGPSTGFLYATAEVVKAVTG